MTAPVPDAMRFEQRMSDSDALMWTIEKDPLLRSTITAVLILDSNPDRARLLERLERGSRLVPRLRQRVVGNPLSIAPPRWEVDPYFDLGYHVRWMRAPGQGTVQDVLRVAEPIAMQGFDRARPLWELTVVEDVADGRAAIILKIHHAITDGVGAVKIGLVLFDLERDPAGAPELMPEAPEARVLSMAERLVDAMQHERRRQLGVARRMPASAGSAVGALTAGPAGAARSVSAMAASVGRLLSPATTPLSPLMTGRSLSLHFDTIDVPLPDAKAAARQAGGRLNDVFVAAVLRALRAYHEKHGHDVDSLRMAMPINIRNDETADLAGNQFAPARFSVPLIIDDPIAHMTTIRDLVAAQRAEPALALVEPLASVLYRLPATLSTKLFGSLLRGVDFVTSNVPGVPVPVFFAGARMEAQYPFGPLSGSAANFTLLSYVDRLHIGVNTDAAAVPDPELLHACLLDGFAETDGALTDL
jgi:WS/DGAT/MGAT family acyltransferase